MSAPVALVTGASSGIGAQVARTLAAHGCDLMLTARSAAELEQLADEIRAQGRRASWLAIDLLESGASETLVRKTCETFGHVDALVCNAGALKVSPLLAATDEDILESLSMNLVVPMRLSREAARVMVARRSGRIVHVASTFAFVSAPGYSLYTVPKAGLVGLTKSMALEFARDGIQVNAIAPGQVRTPMIGPAIERFGEQRIAELIPVGRIAEPAEIAAAVKFLVLDAPGFMTGDVMIIDGGYLCR